MNTVRFVRLSFLFIVFFIFLSSGASGQKRTLKGLVTTYDSISVSQAEIKVKSSGEEFKTDSLGRFELSCEPKDKIIFNAKGFRRQAVKVSESDNFLRVDIELKEGDYNFELAVGPDGHIREADKEKLSTLNDKDVDFSRYSTIYDALRGHVPGVNIVGDKVYIRGQTTIGSRDAEALFVVDGVIVSKGVFSATPTSDIRNIKILKGSAASIYGSRGGNGVVEVYTKRGKMK